MSGVYLMETGNDDTIPMTCLSEERNCEPQYEEQYRMQFGEIKKEQDVGQDEGHYEERYGESQYVEYDGKHEEHPEEHYEDPQEEEYEEMTVIEEMLIPPPITVLAQFVDNESKTSYQWEENGVAPTVCLNSTPGLITTDADKMVLKEEDWSGEATVSSDLTTDQSQLEADATSTSETQHDPVFEYFRSIVGTTYKCWECGRLFAYISQLRKHQILHTGEKPYSCLECGRKFAQKGTLKVHLKSHTSDRSFPCRICGKVFSRKQSVERHQLQHTAAKKTLYCSECDKHFCHESRYHKHMANHAKPFTCQECGKIFTSRVKLASHQRIHTGDKPLKSHQRIHTGDKPLYTCNQCNQSFTHRGNLRRHQERYADSEKPYACTLCHESFTHLHKLQFHQERHEDNIKVTFSCDQCDKTFTHERTLWRHTKCHNAQQSR